VTSKAEQYRAEAQECEELADLCRQPDTKATLLGLAEDWRAMAQQVEDTQVWIVHQGKRRDRG
jgi:hypothetical protein